MEEKEIYDDLTEIFREMFINDEITLREETTAKDIEGWDSFVHLTLIVAIETHFGIKFSTAQIDKLSSVGELVRTIELLKK